MGKNPQTSIPTPLSVRIILDGQILQHLDVQDLAAIHAAHACVVQRKEKQLHPSVVEFDVAWADAWWSMQSDLAAYAHWRASRHSLSWDDEQAFLREPTSQPKWLQEAVIQFVTKLEATGLAMARV